MEFGTDLTVSDIGTASRTWTVSTSSTYILFRQIVDPPRHFVYTITYCRLRTSFGVHSCTPSLHRMYHETVDTIGTPLPSNQTVHPPSHLHSGLYLINIKQVI